MTERLVRIGHDKEGLSMQADKRSRANRRQFILGSSCLVASSAIPAMADTYPTRPVHIIVPSTPGSGTDILSRLLANNLSPMWGQPVVVDNREGAGGVIGTELAAKSAPDGYTLYMGFTGPISVSPILVKNLSYDPPTDFAPVTLVDSSPNVMAISPTLPAKTVKEVIALAKAKPGSLTFGSAGYGTQGHMCAELFEFMSGTKMLHVPYKKESQALTDLMSGQISILFHVAAAIMPLAKEGKVRAIGVTSAKRWELIPDLPSIAEAGIPGYQITVWHGVLAPAKTPQPILTKVQQDMASVMKNEELRKQFIKLWAEPLGTTSEEFARFLKQDAERSASIIKHAGIHIN
jgi:tripartite-type tricarboxylate transporter receptor subunit TctC